MALGAGELLVTSMDRDGTQDGYDLELLRELVAPRARPGDRLGRGRLPEHLAEALEAGCRGRAGSVDLPRRHVSVEEVKAACRERGLPIR